MPSYSIQGDELLRRVQTSFDRFSTGGFMNEAKFTDFCVEMGVGNLSLIKRLFLAMDDDNTGALEAGEFLSALRLMCDGKLDKKRRKRRDEFAFRIFDDDRGGLIELPELEEFVRSFAAACLQLTQQWVGCFEDMLGSQIGEAAEHGAARDVLREAAHAEALQRVTDHAASFCEDFLCIHNLSDDLADDPSEDIEGLFQQMHTADASVEKFSPSTCFALPADDGGKKAFVIFEYAYGSDGTDALIPKKSSENLRKIRGAVEALNALETPIYLAKEKSDGSRASIWKEPSEVCPVATSARGIRIERFKQWCHDSGSGRLNVLHWLRSLGDRWLHTMAQPISERTPAIMPTPDSQELQPSEPLEIDAQIEQNIRALFDAYATDGALDRRSFARCVRRLGLSNPCLVDRFFAQFDALERHFVNREDFLVGFRTLCTSSDPLLTDEFLFGLFDEDRSGYITRSQFVDFASAFFDGPAHECCERSLERLQLGYTPTILDSMCELFPSSAAEEFSHEVLRSLQSQTAQYIEAVADRVFKRDQAAANDWSEPRMYPEDFHTWTQGAAALWLPKMGAMWLAALPDAVDVSPAPPSADKIKSLTQKGGSKKSQRKGSKSDPGIPAPSCKFSHDEVKLYQDTFTRISSDGIMGPEEWCRCMSHLGVARHIAERLFDVFDADGDQEMNAKEFTFGLSDICLGNEEERRLFAHRFYDLTGEGKLSKKEFCRFMGKIKSQCESEVKHAGQEIFAVYGLDVAQMDHSDEALARQRRIGTLSKELDQEIQLYCDDVWEEFATSSGDMDWQHFKEYTAKAPEVVEWLTRLGEGIQQMFPRLKGISFDLGSDVGAEEDPDEHLVLGAHKMIESFDRFAYPRSVENGERTLLTVRSYGPNEATVDSAAKVQQSAGFVAALPLSTLAKDGLGGRVVLNNASVRAEEFYDTTLLVGMPAAELSQELDQMLEKLSQELGVSASDVWPVDPIGDGGPDAAILRVRTLGSASSAPPSTRYTLKLVIGLDGKEIDVNVTIADFVQVVFFMQWKDTEIQKKVLGPNGMQNDLARKLKRSVEDVQITVTAVADASRATVSVRCAAAETLKVGQDLRANFGKVCSRVGLAAVAEEEKFHDAKIVLSRIPANRFDGKAQLSFRQAVSSTLGWDETYLYILENSWPADDQTVITVRFFAIPSAVVPQTGQNWCDELLVKLDEALSYGTMTENLRKKMRGLQDIEASCGDYADSVFSMRTEFCGSLKKDALWPRFCDAFKDEYVEHKIPGAVAEDDGMRIEVIPGTMNRFQFEGCLASLGVTNALFARKVFDAFDDDRSGSIEVGEFIDNFRKIVDGTEDEKHRVMFAVHADEKKVVTERSLRRLFKSFFQPTQARMQQLTGDLKGLLTALPASHFAGERYKAIRKAVVRKQLDSVDDDCDYGNMADPEKVAELERGAGVKVLESQDVGGQTRIRFDRDRWTSIRDRNGEPLLEPRIEPSALSVILQKNCANEADWLVEAMIEHALRYGTQPGQLQRREFVAWAETNTVVSSYLQNIGRPWMVPRDSVEQAVDDEDERADSSRASSLIKKQMQKRVDDARQALSRVITEADIGKQLHDVVKETAKGSKSASHGPTPAAATGVRWSRAFTIIHRSEAVLRNQIRPKTQFDHVNQADVEFVFTKDTKQAYSFQTFSAVLKQLGFLNGRMVRRVFDMLYGIDDGDQRTLTKAECACGMLLLVKGTAPGRLQKSFSFMEKGGRVDESEIKGFLQVYQGVGIEVIKDLLSRSGEVLGPKPVTKGELHAATSFQSKICELARDRLQLAGTQMLAQARAKSMDSGESDPTSDAISLTRDEFQGWVLECPRLKQWLNRLGNASVEALSALEDGNITSAPNTGGIDELPPESTFRLLRKFPLGSHFDSVTPEDVRRVFEAHSAQGRLGVEQFALCLNEMGIFSSFTIRRLFQLFDTDASGAVELHEFASSFLLLCGGPMETKLQKAFSMYDTDASGYLERDELQSMLAAFARVGMDAVGCSLSIVANILGEDATVENEIGRRSRERIERYTASLQASAEHFCYRDAVHLYYSEFVRWARQDRDFFRWLDSLRNAWIETLLEYEEHVGAPDGGNQVASVASEMLRKPSAMLPQPSRAPSVGPPAYQFAYVVSKCYHLSVKTGGCTKRLGYSNRTGAPLQLSLHTDRADLLDFSPSTYVLQTGHEHPLRLQFLPLRSKSAQRQVVHLYLHNEVHARCEECLQFVVTFC